MTIYEVTCWTSPSENNHKECPYSVDYYADESKAHTFGGKWSSSVAGRIHYVATIWVKDKNND